VTVSPSTGSGTGFSGGAGTPDLTAALDVVYAKKYDVVAWPWSTKDELITLRNHLDSVSGPLEQRPGVGVYGATGSLAATTTLSAQINAGRILCAYLRYSKATIRQSLPWEIAAAMAAIMAFEEDPAMPLNTLELRGIAPTESRDMLSRMEQENLLYNGVCPLEVGPGERVQVVRAITTYIVDPQGIEDISLLDITTIRTLDYVRKAVRERISLRFPRAKLSARTPAAVRTEIKDVLYKMEELEILECVEENMDALIVERDLQDPNRLNAKIPADVVNGLHVFAGRIDLLL